MYFNEKNIDLETIIRDEINKYLNRDVSDLPATEQAPKFLTEKYEQMEVPKKGRDIYKVLTELNNEVLTYLYRPNHKRAFSFIPGPASRLSWLGDILTTANNIHASNFANATLPISIERNLINYLADKIGYEVKPSGGVFVSGGSMANLTAVVAARDAKVSLENISKSTVYLTSQTHHSARKAIHIAGFPNKNIRIIEHNDDFTMNIDILQQQIKHDAQNGYIPTLVISTAGTTNTGAIDNFHAIADICEEYNIWQHVDGAYGLSHLLSTKGHELFRGIERSDSATWDAHKLLFQTYSCAMLIVKHKDDLIRSYGEEAEYLEDITSDDDIIDPEMLGIELTRPARAVKLWLTLQVIGEDEFKARIDYGQHLAQYVEKYVQSLQNFEIMSRANLSIVSFRYNDPSLSNEINDYLNSIAANKLANSGYAVAYTTTLNNKKAIRLCTINPETSKEDVQETIQRLNKYILEEKENYHN